MSEHDEETHHMSAVCLFCRIAAGSIPAELLDEDDLVVAFRDVAPGAHCAGSNRRSDVA